MGSGVTHEEGEGDSSKGQQQQRGHSPCGPESIGKTPTGERDAAASFNSAGSRPAVSCVSSRGATGAAAAAGASPPSLDLSQVANRQNTFFRDHRRLSASGESLPKLYRVPNAADMEVGDKKLLRCGDRTVAVFLTARGWHAVDNACYHHGGPLFMGDIEEVEGQLCVVCPWHRSHIALASGVALYDAFVDIKAGTCEARNKDGGPRQRVHEVTERGGDVIVRINPAPHDTYASDRYAVLDIASNDERRMDPDTVDTENCSQQSMKEHIRRRRSSMKQEREMRQREKERGKGPMRVPAGQLTPRGDARGPYVPSWVRKGELPPPPGQDDDDDWTPAHDLAEEFHDLEEEYAKRKEKADMQADSEDQGKG
eukprot:TRINITY_DN47274_c0_g1_i1.p1 TRINITY_DN47274_c0_g1~~TRINITY_DN47274_c0_g1_i1.p1  ORF type:complete len:369 (+),score=109.84 TRINITY_DN47274_c0_g1_i1:123-1229(+)